MKTFLILMEPKSWLVWFISGSLSSLLPVSFMHPPPSTRRHPKALLCYCLPPPVQPTWQSPASLPSPPAAAAWIRSARPVQTSRFCVGSGRGGSLGADTHEADPSFAPVRCSFTSLAEGRGGGGSMGSDEAYNFVFKGEYILHPSPRKLLKIWSPPWQNGLTSSFISTS